MFNSVTLQKDAIKSFESKLAYFSFGTSQAAVNLINVEDLEQEVYEYENRREYVRDKALPGSQKSLQNVSFE